MLWELVPAQALRVDLALTPALVPKFALMSALMHLVRMVLTWRATFKLVLACGPGPELVPQLSMLLQRALALLFASVLGYWLALALT